MDPLQKAEAINAATVVILELLLEYTFMGDSATYERFAGLCLLNADKLAERGTLSPDVGECTIGILEVLFQGVRNSINFAAGAEVDGGAELSMINRRPTIPDARLWSGGDRKAEHRPV